MISVEQLMHHSVWKTVISCVSCRCETWCLTSREEQFT